jgi:hypothetical protein
MHAFISIASDMKTPGGNKEKERRARGERPKGVQKEW